MGIFREKRRQKTAANVPTCSFKTLNCLYVKLLWYDWECLLSLIVSADCDTGKDKTKCIENKGIYIVKTTGY